MSGIKVQNTEQKSNLIYYGAMGALTGFAAKYACPLTEKEKTDNNYIAHKQKTKNEVIEELDTFVKAIEKDANHNDEASKIFLETFSKEKNTQKVLDSDSFKKAGSEIQENIRTLSSQYETLKYNGFENAKTIFKSNVKATRSTNLFLAVGTLAGVAVALANDALNANAKKIEEKRAKMKAENILNIRA